jgi:Transglycosylase SLT domain
VTMTVRRRQATGITATATLALAVLAALAADTGHIVPSADRPGSMAVSAAASPVAVASRVPAGTVPTAAATGGTPAASAASELGQAPGQLVVPDVVATVPGGFTATQLAQLSTLSGVRAVLPVDGGHVMINGASASVLGISPQTFRSWTPPATAAANDLWMALASGDMVASSATSATLGLTPGTVSAVTGGTAVQLVVAATAPLALPGVDAIVDTQRAAQLGLEANVAVLINAPGADLTTLMQQVRTVTGASGNVVNLVPIVTSTPASSPLPVTKAPTTAAPTNYLQLYQDSAADYCPGLSWTVLAAIGQIESGHGTNDGPSPAGALGPMQFIPSTWAIWGIDGFGQTGTPDVMNPLDAVPSAARMLCADGAAAGGASLDAAIYDYNHADWYVSEVLALAGEYAAEYR